MFYNILIKVRPASFPILSVNWMCYTSFDHEGGFNQELTQVLPGGRSKSSFDRSKPNPDSTRISEGVPLTQRALKGNVIISLHTNGICTLKPDHQYYFCCVSYSWLTVMNVYEYFTHICICALEFFQYEPRHFQLLLIGMAISGSSIFPLPCARPFPLSIMSGCPALCAYWR